MKIKRLFSGIGLGLFAFAAVGAGLVGAKAKKAESVKADDPIHCMFSASLDASALEEAYATSNYRFHIWGTNIDTLLPMHPTGQDHVYTVIAYLTDSQIVTGAQFVFYQDDGWNSGDKYSENLNLYSATSESSDVSKDINNGASYSFKGTTDWTDGHWGTSNRYVVDTPKVAHTDHTGGTTTWYEMVLEPENHRYAYYGMEIAQRYIDMISFEYPASRNSFIFFPYNMLNKFGKAATNEVGGSSYWTYLNEAGTYDIFIEDTFDGEGIISLKKHETETSASIYYVTNSPSATTDCIYSWGGEEQFGSFPGTPIADLVTAEKARELTGNGVIHFQGGETAKLIYEIDISIGYPDGDLMFMFNNGTSDYKSDERFIVDEAAYWWTGPANSEAGDAIEFLVYAEARRNAADSYSVCNISEANAAAIINMYNAFDAEIRATYIDCTLVYTWTDKTHTASALFTYRKVVEELGKKFNLSVAGLSPSAELFAVDPSNANLVLIISIVALVSVSSLSLLVVLKKRKHN